MMSQLCRPESKNLPLQKPKFINTLVGRLCSGRSNKPRAWTTLKPSSMCHPSTPQSTFLRSYLIAFHTNDGSHSHVINYKSDKHSGLVVVAQMWLEGNTTFGSVWETSSAISTTIHRISFHNRRRYVGTYSQTHLVKHNVRVTCNIQIFHTQRQICQDMSWKSSWYTFLPEYEVCGNSAAPRHEHVSGYQV
jgi:hypothetical protein